MQTKTFLYPFTSLAFKQGWVKPNFPVILTLLLCSVYSSHIIAQNTILGANALPSNGGTNNVALGAYSMNTGTTPSYNSATGWSALRNIKTGGFNTANGAFALYNTTVSGNTAVGYAALYNTTTGGYNTAVGYFALYRNTTGAYNKADGYYALYNNQTGNRNVAIGNKAMYSSVANSSNVAIGDSALYAYNDGTFEDYMVAIGKYTLGKNTTGFFNAATGGQSLLSNTTGNSNTANGIFALLANTTGSCNTAVGRSALDGVTTGSNNTAIGCSADISNSTFSNATAIGSGALATASNQVMLGNTSVTSVKSAGTYVIMSDGRFKDNRKENVPGLEFIKALKPVTYNYNIHRLNSFLNKGRDKAEADGRLSGGCCSAADEEAMAKKEKKLYTGFIAQEVEAAANQLGYDFSGVYKPQNDKDAYGLSYSDFVVPLVAAVQELSQKNDEKDAKIEDLQKQINDLKAMITSQVSGTANGVRITGASITSNVPNPVRNSTSIRYNTPFNTGNAQLSVTDNAGKIIKQFKLNAGAGVVTIDASLLPNGSYNYTLIIDGKVAESKKMVVSH